MISASLVKELREQTGAGMMDCKKALAECDGNLEAAVDWLREKGIAKAGKKEARIAAEGLADIFIEGNKAVMIEVNAETDFVSKNEEFTEMIKNIGQTILNSDAKTLEEANELAFEDGTIKDYVVAKTAKIGEKLDFRRVAVIEKNDTSKIDYKDELYLILDNIQDPGNLGTIIRSAVAFNFDTIILSNDSVDVYNSKVIRASQGLLFNVNIKIGDLTEIIPELKNNGYQIYGTKVTNGNDVKSIAKNSLFAIIMGNEGNGMSDAVSKLCDSFVYINMNDKCESLNVGVAASILMYELGSK